MGTGPNSGLTLVPDPWLGYRTAAVSRAASGRACISTGPLVPSLFIFAEMEVSVCRERRQPEPCVVSATPRETRVSQPVCRSVQLTGGMFAWLLASAVPWVRQRALAW